MYNSHLSHMEQEEGDFDGRRARRGDWDVYWSPRAAFKNCYTCVVYNNSNLSLPAKGPKSTCRPGGFLLEGLRESAFLASLLAPGGGWQRLTLLGPKTHHSSLRLHFTRCSSLRAFTGLATRTPATGFGTHPHPLQTHLNSSHLQRPYFQIKSCPEAP